MSIRLREPPRSTGMDYQERMAFEAMASKLASMEEQMRHLKALVHSMKSEIQELKASERPPRRVRDPPPRQGRGTAPWSEPGLPSLLLRQQLSALDEEDDDEHDSSHGAPPANREPWPREVLSALDRDDDDHDEEVSHFRASGKDEQHANWQRDVWGWQRSLRQ